MLFRQLFDRETCTYTYLLADITSKEAVLIDPVKENLDRDRGLLAELNLRLLYTLETHIHADHITSGGLFRLEQSSQTVVSAAAQTHCADRNIVDGDEIVFGAHRLQARATPGHTSTCMSYYCESGKMIFTGDTLFIRGCGRTDFQQGNSEQLYRSVHDKIFSLSDDTLIYPGHDYKGRTVSTVGEEKKWNPRLGGGKTITEFVKIMDGLNLSFPKRIKQAVPANMQCGVVPDGLPTRTLSPSSEDTWAPIVRQNGIAVVPRSFLSEARAQGYEIIDVRRSDEFKQKHVENAKNMPLNSLEKESHILDKNKPIVCICLSGVRSMKAAALLERLGFRAASVEGGMTESGTASCG
ncbi:MAG: MBL fold metallo-hydrolase [Myxococcota bacterium]|nr:MBL fold metallo-hydrolase [Myxococcota bacterium]